MKERFVERKVYDHVISLGDSCQTAYQLNRLGLRYASYPFDWLFTWECGMVTKAICTEFSNWLKKESLQESEPGTEHRVVHDTRYGAIHQHIFPLDESVEEAYDAVKAVVDRRCQRLLSLRNQRILFVRVNIGREDSSMENIALLEQALVHQFGTNIHLMVLLHSRSFEVQKLETKLQYTSVYEIYNEGEGKRAIWNGYDPHWDLLFRDVVLSEEAVDMEDETVFINFYACEGSNAGNRFRWTKDESTVDLRRFTGTKTKLWLSSPFLTKVDILNAADERMATIEVNDLTEYLFDVSWETRFVTIRPETAWTPREKFGSVDDRLLGVVVNGVRIYRQ